MNRMQPPRPEAIICRTAAREVRKPPSRCTASSFFQSLNLKSSIGATIWMPALLTSTSTAPRFCCTCAKPASTAASSVTSICTARVLTPFLAMSSAVAWASASFRSAMTRLAPASAKTSAMRLPMPLAEPVTRAVLPFRLSVVLAWTSGVVLGVVMGRSFRIF